MKFFFARLAKTDETDVEKWCLITIARLSLADAFSEKIARMEKLPMIFTKANDTIAGRKLPSALCIANCASNKLLRVRLVKHKAFQLFVDMSKVSSAARSDMAEYQRVAALGLKNLSASFDLRALAAKVGVLEAVVKMLRSKDLEVARYAARAAYRATSKSFDRNIFTTASNTPTLAASALKSKLALKFFNPNAATRWYSAMSERAADDTLLMSTNSWNALCFTSRTRKSLFDAQLAMHNADGSFRPAIVSFAFVNIMGSFSMRAIFSLNASANDNRAMVMRHHFSTSVSSVLASRAKKNFTVSSSLRRG